VTEEQKDILVAILHQWGIEGFEEQENLLIASGKSNEIDEKNIEDFLETSDLKYSKSIVEAQNWNSVWEANFEPVQVEDFVGIRADFHAPIQNVAYEIVIMPKMSFGTGHHATTWLMLKLMKDISIAGKTVFDFGTGTGILAIMAEKLGADSVLAVDYDDCCIENASENFERNSCKSIELEKADSAENKGSFSVILANINKNVILKNVSFLDEILKTGGDLVLSGLLADDENDVLKMMPSQRFALRKKLEKNGWIALHLQKQV
jgi:ribosomal protein L11 methyltransferase